MAQKSNDLAAIHRVRAYGRATILMYLIIIAAWLIFEFFALTPALSYTYSNFGPNSAQYQALDIAAISVGMTSAFIIVFVYAIVKIRGAFLLLGRRDDNFDRPVFLVNTMAALLVAAAILAVLGMIIQSAALLVVVAMVGIAGYIVGIWGIALGLWRLGSKYNNTVLKIGAIIAIFSGLPGLILIYLGAGELQTSAKKL